MTGALYLCIHSLDYYTDEVILAFVAYALEGAFYLELELFGDAVELAVGDIAVAAKEVTVQ